MLDLTQFIGSTSFVGNTLAYEIDGTVMPDSQAVFETVQPDKLMLKGTLMLPFGGKKIPINDGELEAKTTDSGNVTLGYSLGGHKLMEQNYSPTVSGSELDLTLIDTTVHKAKLSGVEHHVVAMLFGIEKAFITYVPSSQSGQTDTKISATSTFLGITVAATLVPKS